MSAEISLWRLRFAHPQDIPRIIELMRHHNMHHIPSPEMGPLNYRYFIVAELRGTLLGAAGYTFLPDQTGKTTLMAVHPACTQTGLGRTLQFQRMQILRSLGCKKVITNADRPETIAWYKRHFGYREIGKLAKLHAFGREDIHEWTTLQADLTDIAVPMLGGNNRLIGMMMDRAAAGNGRRAQGHRD